MVGLIVVVGRSLYPRLNAIDGLPDGAVVVGTLVAAVLVVVGGIVLEMGTG